MPPVEHGSPIVEEPGSQSEAAEVLRAWSGEGRSVRFRGGGSKLGWGGATATSTDGRWLSTRRLDGLVEHNAADLTAVVQAGLPFEQAQDAFGRAGQMMALDPPTGPRQAPNGDGSATIGGVVATGDTGPLRHRYGGARDQLLGITVALSDGTVATSGGKVIKNVAGYDLAKLFTGSFGTLGLILQVAVRLHPLPARRATASGSTTDRHALQRAAIALAHAPLELESLDVAWRAGTGTLLARAGGDAPRARVGRALAIMADGGLEAEAVDDEAEGTAWASQRAGQRSDDGCVLRVSGLPSMLARVLAAVDRLGASMVGRASAGLSWISLPAEATETTIRAIEDLRTGLAPAPVVVLDGASEVRERLDVWDQPDEPALELMRRVKARFDPAGACNPGVFVGGI